MFYLYFVLGKVTTGTLCASACTTMLFALYVLYVCTICTVYYREEGPARSMTGPSRASAWTTVRAGSATSTLRPAV